MLLGLPGCMFLELSFRHLMRRTLCLKSATVQLITEQLLRKKNQQGKLLEHFWWLWRWCFVTSPWFSLGSSLLCLCGFLCSLVNVNFNPAKNGLLLSRKRERKWNFQPSHYAKPFSRVSKKQKQKHDSASLGQTDTLTHFVHSGLFLR